MAWWSTECHSLGSQSRSRVVFAILIAAAVAARFFCVQVEAQSSATILAPSATATADGGSVGNRSWSGQIVDARGGPGSITLTFSSDGGTFVASFCCNMSNTGTITNFAQGTEGHATFVLHSTLSMGCDYSVVSYVTDDHLRGSYQGCGTNTGSFDLALTSILSNGLDRGKDSADVPSPAPSSVTQSNDASTPFPSPSLDATHAHPGSGKPRENQVHRQLCIITGDVQWDRTPKEPIIDVPLGEQSVEGPLKGALVVVTGDGKTRQVVTDTHGAFKIAVPVGSFTFEVQAPGYVPERIPLTIDPSSLRMTFATSPYEGSMNGDGIDIDGAVHGAVCAEVHAEIVPSTAPSATEEARIARVQQAQIVRFRQAHAREQTLGRIQLAVDTSINAYCKKATKIACSLYMSHAYGCISTAIDAERIYRVVQTFERQGFSSEQAVNYSGGSDVAEGAAEMINGMSKKDAADQKWPEIFARSSVLPACLDGGR